MITSRYDNMCTCLILRNLHHVLPRQATREGIFDQSTARADQATDEATSATTPVSVQPTR